MTERKRAHAAALKYDPQIDAAPKLKAAGKGFVAEKIIETARAAGIPIYEDSRLAELLGRLRVGDEIPAELFEVVAELLAYIATVDTRLAKQYTSIY
jgi:flagellar biosynthesis protein